MRSRLLVVVVAAGAALVLAAAVLLLGRDGAAEEEEPPVEAEIVHVELRQVADPTLFGTARLEELGAGRTRVTLEVVQPPVGEQSARITAGDCERPSAAVHELEPVAGSPDVAEPGRSETALDVPLAELVDAGLVVEVDTQTPEDELALCGRLQRPR